MQINDYIDGEIRWEMRKLLFDDELDGAGDIYETNLKQFPARCLKIGFQE